MNEQINSITRGPRQTNMEILRMVAMFLVLCVHANFWALGEPTHADLIRNPLNISVRILLESFSIICVNVFILISGWFGIKSSIKGFCNFIFQCLYFYIGVNLAIELIQGEASIIVDLKKMLNNWFINSYTALYILAPVLNKYLENTPPKKIAVFLISFFVFQTIFGGIGTTTYIQSGYSPFSFIGLYILSGYCKRYANKDRNWLLIFFICIFINALIFELALIANISLGACFSYINPLVIISALALTISFSKFKIKYNRILNYISASCFAVFLFHCIPAISKPYYKTIINEIFNRYNGIICITAIFLFLIIVFIVAVIIDQGRILLWKYLKKSFNQLKTQEF